MMKERKSSEDHFLSQNEISSAAKYFALSGLIPTPIIFSSGCTRCLFISPLRGFSILSHLSAVWLIQITFSKEKNIFLNCQSRNGHKTFHHNYRIPATKKAGKKLPALSYTYCTFYFFLLRCCS